MAVDLSHWGELDDRPPLLVDHLACPEAQDAARTVDRYLGILEVSATWARNSFRDAVAADTADRYRADFLQIGQLMADLAALTQKLDSLVLRSESNPHGKS
jgi:hypothetical protein